MNRSVVRAMWLLNHGSARKFEIPMLKRCGIDEIFLPKCFPNDPSFRSGSVDWSEDAGLTLPAEALQLLNATDWYQDPSAEAWEIANRYFDVVFFILADGLMSLQLMRKFRGALVLRAYGLDAGTAYATALDHVTRGRGRLAIERSGGAFWFGEAYEHLHLSEPEWMRRRSVYLPVGLPDAALDDRWSGSDAAIFFVCPDLGFNPYYRAIYRSFLEQFGDLPYRIGGAQPVAVDDPNVLGFVPREVHERNMRELRVMFYHSREPNHLHYHPLEAVRAGMPLVFMAEGVLDRLGGKSLPGRCKSEREARSKIERILAGDRTLIDAIRGSQRVLIDAMAPEHLLPAWQAGMRRVLESAARMSDARLARPHRPVRIAIIMPIAYRGGTLLAAKLIAELLHQGGRQAGVEVDAVFAYPDEPSFRPADALADLPQHIQRRAYRWKQLEPAAAARTLVYAGAQSAAFEGRPFIVPDDGASQFLDCDLWVTISDRFSIPLLPLRPQAMVVFDYLQRYEPVIDDAANHAFIAAQHEAERVLVTSRFSESDALDYAGLSARRVVRVTMPVPRLQQEPIRSEEGERWFLWSTNLGIHKNHAHAFEALFRYYEELGGELPCRICGVNSDSLLTGDAPHLAAARSWWEKSERLQERVTLVGELSDAEYRRQLGGAEFLWHPARIDNGSFTVLEAAQLGVPALSSRYPAMEELDAQFQLNLAWMDPYDPQEMAERLRWMETQAQTLRAGVPDAAVFEAQSVERLALQWWRAIEPCL